MRYSCKAVVGHGQKCEPNYQCDACAAKQKYIPRIEKLEAALREPTLPMLLAGKKSLYSCSEDPEIEDARACFLAMARTALEGKDD